MKPALKPAKPAHARGQALTEFLVLAVALVPLYLLLPLVAKYQDVAGQVQLASRYIAFEAITRNDAQNSWKTPAELAGEVRRRFFGNADAPVKTGDTAGNFLAHQNLFWRGPDGAALIADIDRDVVVSFGPGLRPGQADAFSAAGDGAPFHGIGGIDSAAAFDLAGRGIYTANVGVRLAKVPASLTAYAPFDSIDLTLSRHASVVIDGWAASGPPQVLSRIDGALVPATVLRGAAPAVGASVALVEAGHLHGPKLGQLDFWTDVVPLDRLK